MSQKSGSLFDMQFITSCISTMLVLLLLGMVVFFVMTANNLSVYVRENINFSVSPQRRHERSRSHPLPKTSWKKSLL